MLEIIRINKFMNKQEASQKVDDWKEERVKVFCPLIKNYCRLDCESLSIIRAVSILDSKPDGDWMTLGGYCECRLLHSSEC